MTAIDLIHELSKFSGYHTVHMTSRIRHGTSITKINYVGFDKHGNLVVTFDDNLIKKEETTGTT